MLDKRTFAILSVLNKQVGNGYKVCQKQELINAMPKRLDVNAENFDTTLDFLKENDFVSVKYQDKEEVCLALTARGTSTIESDSSMVEKARLSSSQIGVILLLSFVGAFLGAMVALLLMR